MTGETHLLQACIEQLRQLPGIPVDVTANEIGDLDQGIDASLRLCSPRDQVEYVCEVQQNVSQAIAGVVLERLQRLKEQTGLRPLLISNYVGNDVSNRLIQQGLEFIDAAGNMYLNSPAAYVLIQGKRTLKPSQVKHSVFTVTSLKLIYALLTNPDLLLVADYREVGQLAGISLGSVSSSIQTLFTSGYLQRQRGGGYRLDDYSKLVSIWELGYLEKLRPKLFSGTFSMAGYTNFTEVSEQLQDRAEEVGYLIGGELGAAIATGYLRPQRATLHVTGSIPELSVALRLRPSLSGEITLLQQFGQWNRWQEHNHVLVSPLLMRAELLVEQDDRLRETAGVLLDRYISGGVTHANNS